MDLSYLLSLGLRPQVAVPMLLRRLPAVALHRGLASDTTRGPPGVQVGPDIVHVRSQGALLGGPGRTALLIAGDSGVKFKMDVLNEITGEPIFVPDTRSKKEGKMKQLAEQINFCPEELGAEAGILRLNGKDARDVCAAALSYVRANPNQKISVLLTLFGNELVKMGSWKIKPPAEQQTLLKHLKDGVESVFEQPNVYGGKVVFGSGPWPAVEKNNKKGEWYEVVGLMAEELAAHVSCLDLNIEVSPEIDVIEEEWIFRDGLHFSYHAEAPVTRLFQQWAQDARRMGDRAVSAGKGRGVMRDAVHPRSQIRTH
mmetsp:Transcript_64238/g.114617  ORF Transcript_64238/g.114617 Transcript_64238/m.114617 type:complete len:313 (+) Transcript_64238:2-940(+)